MIRAKFIGCGAAGNKAAICLMENGVFDEKHTILINSTVRDIPEKYRKSSIIFSDGTTDGGCGKERDIGKAMLLNVMRENKIDPDQWVDPLDQIAIVCGSTEGGSGSASVPIIAKYLKEVVGIPVLVCLFFGFEDDIRGLQNSIEICQELSDEFGVMGISNKKFLGMTSNKIMAEKYANAELINRLSDLLGHNIRESSQNIDDTDLYKLVTTPGYMDVGSISLGKFKNIAQYNDAVSNGIDESKSLNVMKQSVKRIGLIFNIEESLENNIDFTYDEFKKEFGTPYELFTHLQYNTGDSRDNYVFYIAAGMDMPVDDIKEIYETYKRQTVNVKKSKDTFFDTIGDFRGDQADEVFNSLGNKSKRDRIDKAKLDFFAGFGATDVSVPTKKSASGDPKKKVTTIDNTEY